MLRTQVTEWQISRADFSSPITQQCQNLIGDEDDDDDDKNDDDNDDDNSDEKVFKSLISSAIYVFFFFCKIPKQHVIVFFQDDQSVCLKSLVYGSGQARIKATYGLQI